MRRIEQPGPATGDRVEWAEARGEAFEATLQGGIPLLEAVRQAFAAAGFSSGVLDVGGLALSPFAYVMPALSRTPEHAAFYSETFRPAGTARLDVGAMTFGARDGNPFFHCHALWTEADGTVLGGHILPDETTVAETITLPAYGLAGAGFSAYVDPETHFKLFGPAASATPAATRGRRCFALRVRPNVDLAGALEAFCAARGVAAATVHGGVGSTIGARFDDGRTVENFATEVAISEGRVVVGGGTRLDVALVDYTGAMARGRLRNGDNPVLMTFELVLEAE